MKFIGFSTNVLNNFPSLNLTMAKLLFPLAEAGIRAGVSIFGTTMGRATRRRKKFCQKNKIQNCTRNPRNLKEAYGVWKRM